ncbi:CPBP family intramembrane glutamic endopeptidase [Lactiplantibacillus daowaiensis]|uniref:CPBP family intramembrane glutamic endopeptidase n=1 Tax=Lactiplantibacillus daowaiensis TaxID=2559918 RepID=A0ABW1RYE2_9LACO|nr:type II CAAX endopeptidase family protein [Lactiplantibacillus daowaiensis]
MARLKRILKRWPGVLVLIGFFLVYSVAEVPMILLAFIKHPTVIVQVVITLVGILALAGAAWWMWRSYQKQPPIKRYFTAPTRSILFMVVMILIVAVGQAIPTPTSTNQAMVERLMRVAPVGMTIMTVIGAPICEELIFRGLFFRWLLPTISSWQTGAVGVIISALIFGCMHTSLLSIGAIPYLMMGVAFALTYVAFNDIRYNMALHMLNNLIATIMFFMMAY